MVRLLPTNQAWRYWGAETFFSDMESLGVDAVDLWLCNHHANVDAHGTYNADELVGMAATHGVRVDTLTPEQSNPKAYNVASCDGAIRSLTLGYYRQVVRLAARLGARRISINTGWRALDQQRDVAWGRMVSCIRDVCDMALEHGVQVCIEPLVRKPYRLVSDLDALERALDDVGRPNARATLDVGTIARNGESLRAYLGRLGGRVSYVHLTNYCPGVSPHLAWGDPRGALKPEDVLRTLSEGGYDGDCALEMTCPTYFDNPRDVLSRALSTLKGCEPQ